MADREKVIAALEKACRASVELPPFVGRIEITKEAIEEGILPLLREQEPFGGWISVKERMPEERGRYLCWFGKNTLCVGADIATYLPEWHGFGILETDTVLQNVTHWMPLPKQPEGVSEDGIT